MEDKYTLQVYYPGTGYNVWMAFKSETPFQAISKGDILNTTNFPEHVSGKSLRVIMVEHILSRVQREQAKHHVNVFTEEIDNSERLRVSP